MKKQLLFITAVCLSLVQAKAQTPFPTMEFVDINKVKAAVLVHGDMWWDPVSQTSRCFFPSTSTRNIGFAGALWMSGYDGSSTLHIASQMYRQNGNDYWPGPIDTTTGVLDLATSTDWAKIWKIKRDTIKKFLMDTAVRTTANTPKGILEWPGKGNTYARGNAGAALNVIRSMAPFVDLNANGIYEPLLGEYPDVAGDLALWWVVSDNGPTHDETNGVPLGVEIKMQAFAYKRGTLIDNVIYYQYDITNRSTNNYTNFRIGQFADMDLGAAFGDYVGFDSAHRMGIVYNGTTFDSVYGASIPIAGVTMIILPGDVGTTYVPAGSFMYFNNDASVIGNPATDMDYNNYLRAQILDGTHITNDYTVAGTPTVGYYSGPSVNYVYPGDPSDSTQWSECSSGNTPGDRRFVITSNDFTLNAGQTQKVVMALVTTNEGANNACGTAGLNFDNIKIVADTAWNIYFNPYPIPPINTGVASVTAANVRIYPNPAKDKIFIENTTPAGEEFITIYNTVGQVMQLPISKVQGKFEVELNTLPTGLYHVLYRTGGVQKSATFMKQ